MSPVTKYVTEKTEFNDEEIDRLITKYLDIKDRNKFDRLRSLLNDYYDTLKLAKEKAKGDDDTRILTKEEAESIIDNTLSRKYGMYLNTMMYIHADNVSSIKNVFFVGVFSLYLALSGMAFLLGTPLLLAGWLTVTNVYGAFRDFKRTRLVIVKEIEKINNTIERLEKEENPDQEKIKNLKQIRSLLIKQSGYNKSDKKWKEVTTRKVYNKITNMYQSFVDITEADDSTINYLESEYFSLLEAGDDEEDQDDIEDKIDDKIDDAQESDDSGNSDDNEDDTDNEGEAGDPDNPPMSTDEDGNTTVDATTHDSDGFDDPSDTFGDGDNSVEEKYKIQFCIEQLYNLKNKFEEIYSTLIPSDTYRSIVYNEENKDNILLAQYAEEMNRSIQNLNDYLATSDFSSYSLVAIKLSTFNKIFEKIDTNISTILNKYVDEDEDS